jgi:hypothetical protein
MYIYIYTYIYIYIYWMHAFSTKTFFRCAWALACANVILETHNTHTPTHPHQHTHRAVSAGVSELKTRISGRSISGGRPIVADAVLAKVEAEEAAKRAGAQGADGGAAKSGWGGWFRLKAPPLEHEPPLDSVIFKRRQTGLDGQTNDKQDVQK